MRDVLEEPGRSVTLKSFEGGTGCSAPRIFLSLEVKEKKNIKYNTSHKMCIRDSLKCYNLMMLNRYNFNSQIQVFY